MRRRDALLVDLSEGSCRAARRRGDSGGLEGHACRCRANSCGDDGFTLPGRVVRCHRDRTLADGRRPRRRDPLRAARRVGARRCSTKRSPHTSSAPLRRAIAAKQHPLARGAARRTSSRRAWCGACRRARPTRGARRPRCRTGELPTRTDATGASDPARPVLGSRGRRGCRRIAAPRADRPRSLVWRHARRSPERISPSARRCASRSTIRRARRRSW